MFRSDPENNLLQNREVGALPSGNNGPTTEKEAASRAGMSEHQMKTTVRVSKVRRIPPWWKRNPAFDVRVSPPACRFREHPFP